MKKRMFLLFGLVLCLLLTSCNGLTASTTAPETSAPTLDVSGMELKSFSSWYTEMENFRTLSVEDDSAEKQKQVELFGVTYDMTYTDTTIYKNGTQMHNYEGPSQDSLPVLVGFDKETGEIARMNRVPYDWSVSSEEELIALARELAPKRLAEADYHCVCMTHFYSYSNGVKTDLGFLLPSEEEKGVVTYYVQFVRTVCGMESVDAIMRFYIEENGESAKVSLGYQAGIPVACDERIFEPLKAALPALEENMINIGKTSMSSAFGAEIRGHTLFVRDGMPYIYTRIAVITVDYDGYRGEDDMYFISGFFEKEVVTTAK